ncbi:MAG: flagellar hook-length control protein FliK [Bacteroidetes bacterium]|nr:flagellar hook-length control protein FliK [Bacteroidota bacterium]MCW5895109.1 flagellar hook-length control protein FliK [Bacteroidota bacterium]
MIGLLQGLFSGTSQDSHLPAASLSEKCSEDRVEGVYSEPADAGTSFFAMLVQLFTHQSSKQPEHTGMATVEAADEKSAFTTIPEANEQKGEAAYSPRLTDPPAAKMTLVFPTRSGAESASGTVDALQVSNTQIGDQSVRSSAQSHLVEKGEQKAPVHHEVGQLHRATEQLMPVALQRNTEHQSGSTVRSALEVPPTQNVVIGGSNSKSPTENVERRSEGFPLHWNKTGSSETDRASVREIGRPRVVEGLQSLSSETGRPSVRETGRQGVAEELQILTSKFSTGWILKRETPESNTRMNLPAENSEDISTDETGRVHTLDSENHNQENKAGLQQSPSRSNPQSVKQAGTDQLQIPQPSVKIPEPASTTKENPVNLSEQSTENVVQEKVTAEDSETNTDHDVQPDPSLHSQRRTLTETKHVPAPNQDIQSEAAGRPASFELQHIPAQSRPEISNSFQVADKLHIPVQIPQDFAQNLIVRISDELKAHIEGKSSEVRVVMKPESMGQLSLRVALEDGRLVAIMDVSKTAVKIALEAQLPQLREALAAQGINVERFDILSGSTTQFERHGDGNAFHRQQHSRRQMDVDVAERYETVKYLGYNTVEYII